MSPPQRIEGNSSRASAIWANSRPRGGIPRSRPESVALLSYGFRPFSLGAALWAWFAMVLWIGLAVVVRMIAAIATHEHNPRLPLTIQSSKIPRKEGE
jgi:hypothetical protein